MNSWPTLVQQLCTTAVAMSLGYFDGFMAAVPTEAGLKEQEDHDWLSELVQFVGDPNWGTADG